VTPDTFWSFRYVANDDRQSFATLLLPQSSGSFATALGRAEHSKYFFVSRYAVALPPFKYVNITSLTNPPIKVRLNFLTSVFPNLVVVITGNSIDTARLTPGCIVRTHPLNHVRVYLGIRHTCRTFYGACIKIDNDRFKCVRWWGPNPIQRHLAR